MPHIIFFNFIVIIFSILLNSCSSIRESAGVTRKSADEFQVIKNPLLIIPPDFNLVAPDQLQKKNIEDIEKELAQEILFGLDEKEKNTNQQLSTMNKILLQANATDASKNIKEEFDQEFSQEKKTDNFFQIDWENEEEVLDAVQESERLRNKNFQEDKVSEDEIPIISQKVKVKKKKRFFFF